MELLSSFVDILKSDTTRNVIMIISASAAFIIYFLNKRDQVRNAANIILLEIKEIETIIGNVRSGQALNISIPILKSNSWKEYKHLFVKKLDSDEFQQLNMFYSLAETIEKERAIIADSSVIAMEEKEKSLQKILIEITKEYAGNQIEYEKKRDDILTIAHAETYIFEPAAPKERLNRAIIGMPNIINTNIGQKLKKNARYSRNRLAG